MKYVQLLNSTTSSYQKWLHGDQHIAKIWRGVQQRLDRVVNLGRANAHATGVERCIALDVDHKAPVLRRLTIVAVQILRVGL